jgi:hypothetical protein
MTWTLSNISQILEFSMTFDFEKLLSDIKNAFTIKNQNDEDLKNDFWYIDEKEVKDEVNKIIEKETGRERIEKFFDKKYFLYNFGLIYKFLIHFFCRRNAELDDYGQNVLRLFIVGFILGGVNRVAVTTDNFKRANQLTVYVDKKTATVRKFTFK